MARKKTSAKSKKTRAKKVAAIKTMSVSSILRKFRLYRKKGPSYNTRYERALGNGRFIYVRKHKKA